MIAQELIAYLEPLNLSVCYPFAPKTACMSSQVIDLHGNPQTVIQPNDILIIGVGQAHIQHPANAIRSQLYGLISIPYKKGKIIDAGNLPATLALSQQYSAIEQIARMVAESKAILILLGPYQESFVSAYNGFSKSKDYLRLAIVDHKIDWDSDSDDFHAQNFANLLLDEPYEKLLDISFIGIQGYFTSQASLDKVQRRKHEVIRLGNLRGKILEAEPVLRDAHLVNIDINAVRASDAPGVGTPTPNGLYAEEVCMLARLAGLSQNGQILFVSGLASVSDSNNLTSMLAAQVVWHYIEGITHRKLENPLKNAPENKKYVVSTDVSNVDMIFYKNEVTGSWWMEVPVANRKKIPRGKLLFRCTSAEYQLVSYKEIPARWLRWYKKAQKI